ncbi:glucan endo-1,3-beta-D-glucosidase [Robertkochia sediminum]|uniref:glucan endo-1,3-beta-D-glucosidase n=1 Tax=Robertkochia sediminum TaxID=2785326 RepID=UPI0019329C6F|nr:glucan endo-1,3-beta-D-glucosidase [Robertkochia sediminum]MBL7473979.1 glucan endo-1,3-beta-D-glucosidase [Robertkochia sediminum]
MKKMIKTLSVLWLLAIVLVSCQEDRATLDPITVPANLEVMVELVGADEANPYGDGSGIINLKATAENAITYMFTVNGVTKTTSGGEATFGVTNTGLNEYNINVVASGQGGLSSSKNMPVEVLFTYEPPQDLLDMLYADGEREWRIKAEAPGHFGLGPVGGQIPTEWYGAGANEKEGRGMYDDRYTFRADGTFTHVTNGDVFGRVGLIDELGGSGGESEGADIINYQFGDYTENWALSEVDGSEVLILNGIGFFGYYTGGSHVYQIFARDANEMVVKTTDGNGEFDWWFTLIATDAGSGVDQ